jgi:phosphotransferase system HPr-like phosphotransfer protein
MATKTPHMATLYFVAEGHDAAEATSALARLVESDFADAANGG